MADTACLRLGYSMLLPQNNSESMSLTQSIALLVGTILVLLLVRIWEKVSSSIRTGKLSPDAKGKHTLKDGRVEPIEPLVN